MSLSRLPKISLLAMSIYTHLGYATDLNLDFIQGDWHNSFDSKNLIMLILRGNTVLMYLLIMKKPVRLS